MLGDVHIAEPGALIGFAGPRVIEQTIREKLPEGFQRAEYLMQHGMVDMVVSRLEMKKTIANLLKLLLKVPENAKPADPRCPQLPGALKPAAGVRRSSGSCVHLHSPPAHSPPASLPASPLKGRHGRPRLPRPRDRAA